MRSEPLLSFALLTAGLLSPAALHAQDPGQPATNLGLTNMLDGAPPAPGTYWFQYVQYYHARHVTDGAGRPLGTARLNTTLYLPQFVLIGRRRVLGGNPGITVLVPLVNINTRGDIVPDQVPLQSNRGLLGDLVVGPNIQWFDRRLLGRPFQSRLELDAILPTGAYDPNLAVNPGSNFFSLEPHYTFTLAFTERLSTSQRHHYTYNFRNAATGFRTGQMYHGNYSVEYLVGKTFRVAAQGYYLTQFTDDDNRGDKEFFRRQFGLGNTRERVLGLGPGLSFISAGGIFFELKSAVETAARNRPEGVRTTFRLIYRFADRPAAPAPAATP
jgi:hypothetical protein